MCKSRSDVPPFQIQQALRSEKKAEGTMVFPSCQVLLHPCQPRHGHHRCGLLRYTALKGMELNANHQSSDLILHGTSVYKDKTSLHPHIYFENLIKKAWNSVLDVGSFLSDPILFYFFKSAATLIDTGKKKWEKHNFSFFESDPFLSYLYLPNLTSSKWSSTAPCFGSAHGCKVSTIRSQNVYKHLLYLP